MGFHLPLRGDEIANRLAVALNGLSQFMYGAEAVILSPTGTCVRVLSMPVGAYAAHIDSGSECHGEPLAVCGEHRQVSQACCGQASPVSQ